MYLTTAMDAISFSFPRKGKQINPLFPLFLLAGDEVRGWAVYGVEKKGAVDVGGKKREFDITGKREKK